MHLNSSRCPTSLCVAEIESKNAGLNVLVLLSKYLLCEFIVTGQGFRTIQRNVISMLNPETNIRMKTQFFPFFKGIIAPGSQSYELTKSEHTPMLPMNISLMRTNNNNNLNTKGN